MTTHADARLPRGRTPHPHGTAEEWAAATKRIATVVAGLVLVAALLFGAAGTLQWPWGWAYVLVNIAILVANAWVMPLDLVAERGRHKENVEPWDRVLSGLLALPMMAIPVVCGLDFRLGWSPALPAALRVVALALIVCGYGLVTWAMLENRFFSTQVRLQLERGHTGATGGPYRFVRHPGYVGMMVAYAATAIALGSLWALVPFALAAVLFVVRTALEDRTLLRKLPGYLPYAMRVRYRLLPGVW